MKSLLTDRKTLFYFNYYPTIGFFIIH